MSKKTKTTETSGHINIYILIFFSTANFLQKLLKLSNFTSAYIALTLKNITNILEMILYNRTLYSNPLLIAHLKKF